MKVPSTVPAQSKFSDSLRMNLLPTYDSQKYMQGKVLFHTYLRTGEVDKFIIISMVLTV